MKHPSTVARGVIALGVLVLVSIGVIAQIPLGTPSAPGWQDIALLCPVGALLSMVSSHTIIPRAVISIIAAVVFFFIFGRAFCAWICPVTLEKSVARFFRKKSKVKQEAQQRAQTIRADAQMALQEKSPSYVVPLNEQEKASLASGCHDGCRTSRSKVFDSRHGVLAIALITTAVFGFPIFCVVCPVGLTFASVALLWRLFAFGDVTIGVVVFPVILGVEVFWLRSWCRDMCPIAGIMTLAARKSRTFLPSIDRSVCIESVEGRACSQCAIACEVGINPVHPERGSAGWPDCTRCRACQEACPAHAITFPLLASRQKKKSTHSPVLDER